MNRSRTHWAKIVFAMQRRSPLTRRDLLEITGLQKPDSVTRVMRVMERERLVRSVRPSGAGPIFYSWIKPEEPST